MKTNHHRMAPRLCFATWRMMLLILLCPLAERVGATIPLPPGGSGPTNILLGSWSFTDTTNWTSDHGYAPLSFTNLNVSNLGNGTALVVDSPDPAWLQYNVVENDGTTNLTVAQGSVMFWFAPNWSSMNQGGTGPGEWGRLIEVGSYTPDSSYGWWSLYVDDGGNSLYFSAQTNDVSSNVWTYVSVPISWTTNRWHLLALTYSATNTALYLDGTLATNGPPPTMYPGPDVLANGFYIGSDSSGVVQAHGMFDQLATYANPLDPGTAAGTFWYEISETATNSMAGASYFRFGAGGSFLGFAALQRGRCAIPCIHPNVPTPGPPTSRAVQVNLRGEPKRCQAQRAARTNRVRNATASGYVALRISPMT